MTRLVQLHGFAGSVETFADVRALLGDAFTCEAPALLGHGARSDATSFEDEVDRLAEAIAPAPPPLLLGYSFGGRLALGLVARHPQRWRGAVVVGAHPGLPDAPERAERRRADAHWIRLLRTGDIERFTEAWEAQPIFASQRNIDPERRARQRAARTRHDATALAHAMEVLGTGAMPWWGEALAASGVPIVFLAGGRDDKYVAIGRALAARVPSLRMVVVPDAGHNVALEAPAAVVDAVRMLDGGSPA